MMDNQSLADGASPLYRDDRGSVMAIAALSLVIIFGFAAVAIDLGMQATAAAEAQRTADAGALAAAGALATVPGANELAREEAVAIAAENQVMGESVTLDPDADVLFPGNDSVRVIVRRNSGSPDGPFRTIFASVIGVDSLGVAQDAMAHVQVTGAVPNCLMPFGLPDLWLEDDGSLPGPNDEFDPSTDTYRSPSNYPNNYTGYQIPRDWGREVTIYTSGGPGTYNPSWWGMWSSQGNSTRGSKFKQQITTLQCFADWDSAEFDQTTYTTPGESQGPVKGCVGGGGGCGSGNGTPLIEQDPNAGWAEPGSQEHTLAGCQAGKGCMYRNEGGEIKQISSSPRIQTLPLYHPEDVVNSSPGNHQQTRITNFTGIFFDRVEPSGEVVGYVVGLLGPSGNSAPASGVTTRSVQLIE